MGITEPFFGPIFDNDIIRLTSSASIDVSGFRLRGVEAEWAFELGSDLLVAPTLYQDGVSDGLGPGSLTMNEICSSVSAVFPVIEVVASRLLAGGLDKDESKAMARGATVIADQAGHGLLLVASQHKIGMHEWQHHYSSDPVSVLVNGREAATGSPAAVLGNPLVALQWVLNNIPIHYGAAMLSAGQHPGEVCIPAGTLVTTGTMTGITPVQAGDAVRVTFGSLGQVTMQLSNVHTAHP
jgi:2-keto-4-pentenoate hydratase